MFLPDLIYLFLEGMFPVANDDTCREYMNSPYNANTEANKKIVLRVQPRSELHSVNQVNRGRNRNKLFDPSNKQTDRLRPYPEIPIIKALTQNTLVYCA